MVHNTQAVYNLVEYVGSLPENQRMVRLGSNQLPAATHPDWKYFWKRSDVMDYAAKYYARAGELARQLGVRLSMHPCQFVVLASDNPEIVERSIEEFEYHADIGGWATVRIGKIKCNVHIWAEKVKSYQRSSKIVQKHETVLPFQNDENPKS